GKLRVMKLRNVRIGRPLLPEVPAAAIAAPDLARSIARWLAWLEVERRSSRHTVAAYRRDLWAFLIFLGRHLGNRPSVASLRSLGRPDLRAYLLDRRRRSLHPSSTARALSVLRNFFRFLARHDLVHNPTILQARNPKAPRSVPKALTVQEASDAIGGIG